MMMSLRRFSWGALALLISATCAWADPVGQVVRLSGAVELTRGTATAALVLGAALEAGDRLRTGDGGRVRLQLIDGSIINLGARSELSIDDVVSGGIGTERQVGLDLALGALRAFAAPATPQSRFEIRTPKAITAVRGTEWGILASAVRSDILVLAGHVGVRKNEVSGKSATSLTRTLGVTVTDQGLGQITRWSAAQVAALMGATEVPGPEMDFDLGKAPGINFTPISAPVAPGSEPQGTDEAGKSCHQSKSNNCSNLDRGTRDRPDGQSNQGSGNGGDSGSDSGSDGDGGSSF